MFRPWTKEAAFETETMAEMWELGGKRKKLNHLQLLQNKKSFTNVCCLFDEEENGTK